MAPDDWDRIKHVFSGALGVSADVRDAYVLAACPDRPDLRDAVADLLAAHGEASTTFLEPGALLFDAPWLFRPGDRVADRFTVARHIARGAMGEVYEAHDDRLRLRVALKALRPQLVGDAHTAERFRREVLVTRDIAHEGLCRIFDLLEHRIGPGTSLPEDTQVPCLTMQLLEGESLDEYLKGRRPLRPSEAFPLLIQIAEALDVLHDHGVVHRDLKPSNVMLVARGAGRRAVLTDFGLAKPLDESLFETQSAVPGGAPYFMAPELFRGEKPSRASDLYAFGLLIDELVTHTKAFSADSLHSLMMQKLHDGPVRPSMRADGLPRLWDDVIRRCLDPDPRARFERASEVCLALDPTRRPSRWPGPVSSSLRRIAKHGAIVGATVVAIFSVAAVTREPPGLESVVVMPFANLTGDAANDYLSAGTSGELWRRLSRVRGFRVSAPPREGAAVDADARATYRLSGHVQQAGTTLRITVQLSDQKRDRLVWAEKYEGPRDRALQLEDALAEAAAAALGREVRARETPLEAMFSFWPFGTAHEPDVPTGGTTNTTAYDAYMRGRYLFELRTLPEAIAANALLRRATELDPQFAAPYATLSALQQVLMDFHYRPHDELLRQAEAYAERAVALDPNLPDGRVALASVRQMQSRWDEAEAEFKRTMEMHPTFSRAYRWYGGMLLQFGRSEECLRLVEKARELDPYDMAGQTFYGLALIYSNRAEDAARHLERWVTRGDVRHGNLILGQAYGILAGKPGPERDAFLRKALEQSEILRTKAIADTKDAPPEDRIPRTEFADFVAALAWSFRGNLDAARPFVDHLEAERSAGRVSPSILARVYAVQRRTDDALRLLELSEAQGDRELMYLSVSPLYQHIRTEPRFAALVERMHLNR